MKTTDRHDYPNKPIGGGNPYYMCSRCGVSDPQINGRLGRHMPWCEWRKAQVREYLNSRLARVKGSTMEGNASSSLAGSKNGLMYGHRR